MNKYLTLDELLAVYYHIMVTDRPESPLPAKTKELVNRLKTRAYEKINSKNPAPSVPRGLHPTELGKANILVENLRQAGGQPIARAPHS